MISYDTAFNNVQDEIQKALSSPPPLIRQFTEYLSRSRGKYIRTQALLTCAMDRDGNIHPDGVKFAAAIEILHLATLVHDDVIDDADLRRGIPTFQKKFGKKTAVICGDYLLCVALTTAASAANIREYTELELPDYVSKICTGELNQHLNSFNFKLTVREYLRIISGKTAALFEASYYGGVILSEEDKDKSSEFQKLGRYTGMIFQLMDDCADFEEDMDAEKKPVQSDFEQGVITLPLVIALRDPFLKNRAENQDITRAEINEAVKKSGGISFTKMLAGRYYDKSVHIINELDIGKEKRQKLFMILNKSIRFNQGELNNYHAKENI